MQRDPGTRQDEILLRPVNGYRRRLLRVNHKYARLRVFMATAQEAVALPNAVSFKKNLILNDFVVFGSGQ